MIEIEQHGAIVKLLPNALTDWVRLDGEMSVKGQRILDRMIWHEPSEAGSNEGSRFAAEMQFWHFLHVGFVWYNLDHGTWTDVLGCASPAAALMAKFHALRAVPLIAEID